MLSRIDVRGLLISWATPGRHLAERGQLLRHDELVLGLAELAGPLLDTPLQGPPPLGQVVLGRLSSSVIRLNAPAS